MVVPADESLLDPEEAFSGAFGRVRVDLPAGAVRHPVRIRLGEQPRTAPMSPDFRLRAAFRLEILDDYDGRPSHADGSPAAFRFEDLATLTLSYEGLEDSDLPAEALQLRQLTPSGLWIEVQAVFDPQAKTATISTMYEGTYALVANAALLPKAATVATLKPDGGRLAFGRLEAEFEPGAFDEATEVVVGPAQSLPWRGGLPFAFEIRATRERDQASMDQLGGRMRLKVPYWDSELGGTPAESLSFRFLNERTGWWEEIPSTVDTMAKTVSAEVDHLTLFSLGAYKAQVPFDFGADWAATDPMTGDVRLAMPFELPPGPGGLKPDLKLTYSTQASYAAQRANWLSQDNSGCQTASWIGEGFDIPIGYVQVSKDSSGSGATHRSINIFGQGARLLDSCEESGGRQLWQAQDQQFWKIECGAAETRLTDATNSVGYRWRVIKPDGTKYYFGTDETNQQDFQVYWDYDISGQLRTKFMLSRIQDPHGNIVTITYKRLTKRLNDDSRTMTPAVFPTEIRYGGRDVTNLPYRIVFNRSGTPIPDTAKMNTASWSDSYRDRADVNTSVWVNGDTYQAPFDVKYLSSIDVKVKDTDGVETLARRYVFSVNSTSVPMILDRVELWSDAGGTLHQDLIKATSYNYYSGRQFQGSFENPDDWELMEERLYLLLDRWDNGYGASFSYTYGSDTEGIGEPCANHDDHQGANNWKYVGRVVVARKKVVDPGFGGQTRTTTYQYWLPQGALNEWWPDFRGHNEVWERETAASESPVYAEIYSKYTQNHITPRRPQKIEYKDGAGNVVRRVENAWSRSSFEGGREFIHLDQTVTTEQSGVAKNTVYAFDKYGNQTHVWEHTSAGICGWARHTRRWYFPAEATDRYLVDRLAAENVYGTTNEGKPILAQDINDLCLAVGKYTPRPSYYPVVAGATRIQANHFTDLRASIQNLWNSRGYGAVPNWTSGAAPSAGTRIYGTNLGDLRAWLNTYETRRSLAPTAWYPGGGDGILARSTLYLYDNCTRYDQAIGTTNYTGDGSCRGRLTTVQRWVRDQGQDRYVDTKYTYDAWGNRTAIKEHNALGSIGVPASTEERITAIAYDQWYHAYKTSETTPPTDLYAGGLATTYDYYYVKGRLKSVTDPNGAVTGHLYDALGRHTHSWLAGDPFGQPPDPATATLSFEYQIPDTTPTRIRVGRRKDAGGGGSGTYRYEWQFYDGLGRLIQKHAEYSAQNAAVINHVHSDRGLSEKESVPHLLAIAGQGAFSATDWSNTGGSVPATKHTYDALRRQTVLAHPDDTLAYPHRVQWTYSGWDVIVSDEQGNQKVHLRDGLGRLLQVKERSGASDYAYTYYGYDIADLLTSVTDHLGNRTSITYDELGRKVQMVDPDMGHWAYKYDPVGTLREQTDARGQVLTFEYDKLKRLRYKRNGTTVLGESIYDEAFAGNGRGRRTTQSFGVSLADSVKAYYDSRGRATQSDVRLGGVTYTVGTTYDDSDRVLSVEYPNGETLTYAYTAPHGLPVSLSSGARGTIVSAAAYNELGKVISLSLGNGQTTSYQYWGLEHKDAANNPQHYGLPYSIATGSLQSLVYETYDKVGNPTRLVDNRLGESLNFTYDHLYRLTGVSGAYSRLYSYDAIGRFVAPNYKEGVVYDYNGSGHLHAPATVGGNPYLYDANGNLTSAEGRTYEYNVENRLWTVSQGSQLKEFAYDGDGGLRTLYGTSQSDPTRRYITSDYQVELPSGTPVLYYRFGGRAVAWSAGGSPHYLTADHLGSVQAETDGGTTRERRAYPFGSDRAVSGANDLTRDERFTEQQRVDDGSGVVNRELYHYGARYYLPGVGLFSQADSLVPDPKNPQALNRYAYCINNPVRYTDPSGHAIPILLIAGLGLVGGISGALAGAADASRRGGDVLRSAAVGGSAGLVAGLAVAAGATALATAVTLTALGSTSMSAATSAAMPLAAQLIGSRGAQGLAGGFAAHLGVGLSGGEPDMVTSGIYAVSAGAFAPVAPFRCSLGGIGSGRLTNDGAAYLANQAVGATAAGQAAALVDYSVDVIADAVSSSTPLSSDEPAYESDYGPAYPDYGITEPATTVENGSYSGIKDYWYDIHIGAY